MQLLKEKIIFKPRTDNNIQIPFCENVDFVGIEDDINDFIAEETGLSVNEVEDAETFRYLPSGATNELNIYFLSGGTYYDNYEAAGFTSGETSSRDEVIMRSFYLIQVYDSVFTENQTLLNNGYYNGFNFLKEDDINTTYNYDDDNEFSNIYLANWFIEALTGITTIYGKVSFYNAKTGSLQLFSDATNGQPSTDEENYFEIYLNPETYSYDVNTINSYELSNAAYTEKINQTLESFVNEKPTYPTGSTFLNTGKYVFPD